MSSPRSSRPPTPDGKMRPPTPENSRLSATQLTAERFGSRTPPDSTSVTSSRGRRTPVMDGTDPRKEEIISHVVNTTGVVIKKQKADSDDQVASALDKANAALDKASGIAHLTGVSSEDSEKLQLTFINAVPLWDHQKVDMDVVLSDADEKKPALSESPMNVAANTLDMKHNDNAFHVVANLVVERFYPKLSPDGTLNISEGERGSLIQLLQPSVRESLVDAVKYRLEHNCPPESESHIHVLTRQCKDLGLDQEGDVNPLLAPVESQDASTLTRSTPELDIISDTGNSSETQDSEGARAENAVAASAIDGVQPRPPQNPGGKTKGLLSVEEERQLLRAQLEAQRKQLLQQHEDLANRHRFRAIDDTSIGNSTMTNSTDIQSTTTESLARQQLMSELKEASNFMAESKTPEAALFWRNHVLELQARLRALHGEGATSKPSGVDAERVLPIEAQIPEEATPAETESKVSSEYEMTNMSKSNSYSKERYIPPETEESATGQDSDSGPPTVDVISPADLPGGYHFEAEIDGERFLATVPSGGVRKGETFTCLMLGLDSNGTEPPVGKWRDRLSDFAGHGCLHLVLLNGIFCPLILLGQVMERIDIDWLGRPTRNRKYVSPCWTMGTVVGFWVAVNLFIYFASLLKLNAGLELSVADHLAFVLLNVTMAIYSIYATMQTRQMVREKYIIREQRCYDLEDCCCATFCLPCSVCQMARHTTDYSKNEPECCSATGLKDNLVPKPFEGYSA